MDDRETRRQGDKVTRRFSPSPPLLVTPSPPVVRALDDFAPSASLRAGVTGVTVAVTDAEGNPIESGAATETPANSGRWVYAATAAVPTGTTVRIAVTATDRPGGVAEAEKEKAV